MAPDNAPSAASPPRSSAIVADGTSDIASATVAITFFMDLLLLVAQQ
jgi:hypothetical protein